MDPAFGAAGGEAPRSIGGSLRVYSVISALGVAGGWPES